MLGQGPSTEVLGIQRQIGPMLGEVRKPIPADEILVKQCQNFLDAIHLCVQLSRYKHYTIADKLGIDRGHWSRMMQGQAHFPTNKMHELMQLCGNYAPLQWLAKAVGVPINVDEKSRRRAQLMRELELLDAA